MIKKSLKTLTGEETNAFVSKPDRHLFICLHFPSTQKLQIFICLLFAAFLFECM